MLDVWGDVRQMEELLIFNIEPKLIIIEIEVEFELVWLCIEPLSEEFIIAAF